MHVSSGRSILVVEDEPATRSLIAGYLREAGYVVAEAASGAACRAALAPPARFDLVLLDIRLPDADGVELARSLRSRSDMGLIFVTAVKGEVDRIAGLELGADDYVTKPVMLRELLARVRSTLRRVAPAGSADPAGERRPGDLSRVLKLGAWEIDLVRREACGADGKPAKLTRAEFDLLAALVEAGGRPVSRDYLLDVVSNRSEEVVDRTVDTLVARLRRRIEADPAHPTLILTERGIGYRAAIQRS